MTSEDLFCAAASYPLLTKRHLLPIKNSTKPSARRNSSKIISSHGKNTQVGKPSLRRVRSCPASKSFVVQEKRTHWTEPESRKSITRLLDPRSAADDVAGIRTTGPADAKPLPLEPEKCKKKKKMKMSALAAVKPENQESEKEKFMKSNFTYNPQFTYRNPASDKTLQKHGSPPEKLLPIAIKIIETVLKRYRTYDEYEQKAGGKKLTNNEIYAIVKAFLTDQGLNGIAVQISEDLVARACMTRVRGQPTLQIQSGNIREKWIDGMLRHEIGTHYIRGYNNRQHIWKSAKKRKELKMEPVNPTEEGLASLNTVVLREEPCLIRAAMLYYTVTKAADLSFCELFAELGKYIKDADTRWDYCLRAKRGFSDTSEPGAFQKDQVYLKGLLRILKNRHTIDFNLLFRLGKVCYKDIDKLKHLTDLDNTRVPSFVEDVDKYLACLNNIILKNGLTDRDLEIV